jgi:hypothetical protein
VPQDQKLFQLQKFYNQRHLWDDCFPEFVQRYKRVEQTMEKLANASFKDRARPRAQLMEFFLNKIRKVDNIDQILAKIPDDELIPAQGKKLTKDEFRAAYYQDDGKPSDNPPPKPVSKGQKKIPAAAKREHVDEFEHDQGKPVFKLIANAHAIGGGEFSSSNLMQMMLDRGYAVDFHPVKGVGSRYTVPKGVRRRYSLYSGAADGECDVLMFYANDAVYKLTQYKDTWNRLLGKAARKCICINFVMGESWQPWFSEQLDEVLFLNTMKEQEYLKRLADKKIKAMKTMALAPPVFIDTYRDIVPDYSRVTFVRHSRYTGKDTDADYKWIMSKWRELTPESHYHFMATPPFLKRQYGKDPKFHLYGWDGISVHDFLQQGSLFHYRLPTKMRDQGPRVIVEAMAAGIPVIADNRDGAKDRVTSRTGWLCDNNQGYVDAVEDIVNNPGLLEQCGKAAKERAFKIFDPQRWCTEMIG